MRGQGITAILGILAILCIGVILYINTVNVIAMPLVKEGFASGSSASSGSAGQAKQSAIEKQIRAILDPIVTEPAVGPELCKLYTHMRSRNALNIQARANSAAGSTTAAGDAISEAEIQKQVEKEFATGIPGGALECPLLTYPIPGSTDVDWLSFLIHLPPDFLGRIVYMAVYAQKTLGKQASDIRSALEGISGKMTTITPNAEAFTTVCPVSVETTRRMEKLNRAHAGCSLPEEMSPADIQFAVTDTLKQMVAAQNTAVLKLQLAASGASSVASSVITDTMPPFDLKATIADAATSLAYLKKQEAAAKNGTLTISL